MTNTGNNILQELEIADKYEKIESEMNNLLHESDSVLIKAESQINELTNNDAFKIIEKDIEISSDSSCALSIEVSYDLFKEFDSEHNISAIFPTNVDVDIYSSTKLSDVPEESKNSEESNKEESNEEEDTTIKYNETLGSSLEITITNDVGDDNESNTLETTLLNNSPTFKGCSEEFASNGVEEKIIVIIDAEKGRSIKVPLIENNKENNEQEENNKEEVNTEQEVNNKQEEDNKEEVNNKQEEYNKEEVNNEQEENPKNLQENPFNEIADNQPKNIRTDINSNNEILLKTQKRLNEENYSSDVADAKRLKFDECQASGIILPSTSSEFDFTQTEYSQVLFDPDETADANDPKWSEFNNNFASIEEHFESVRKQWRSMALPNPHKNLSTRFVSEQQFHKYKSATTNTENHDYLQMSCVTYLDNKINSYTQRVNSLYVKLNYLPQSNRGRIQRNKLLREIDELQKFVIEIVKNREEIQQNFKFYQHPNYMWNANFLTKNQLDEMKEQEKLLEFQKKFYSR